MILLHTILPSIAVATETSNLAKGEYSANFTVLKDGTDAISVMDDYTEKPAKVFITDNGTFVELTFKNSDWIVLFQTEQGGTFVDAKVVSEDKAANTRVVRFPVSDLNQKVNAYTHVIVPMINYDNKYTVQIKMDVDTLTAVNVESPEEVVDPDEDNSEDSGEVVDPDKSEVENPGEEVVDPDKGEGENPGEEVVDPDKGEGENPGEEVVDPDKGEDGNPGEEVVDPEEEEDNPDKEPTQPEAPKLEDGNYTIGLRALHASEDKASSMQNYLGNPAKLTVENGKTYVSMEIIEKPGQFLTDIRIENNGAFNSGTVVSEDKATLTRVVKYEIENIASVVNAEVDMHVVAANYRNTQKFRIDFDVDSIETMEDEPEVTDPDKEIEDELAIGVYTVDFNIHKDGTNDISVMDGYTEKPGRLIVEKDRSYAELTLTNSDWIKLFQTEQVGKYVDAEVVSEDIDADTRVVRFPVKDIKEKVNVFTHVVIPMINYDNKYTVQINFDADSLKSIDGEPGNPDEPEIPEIKSPTVVDKDGKQTLIINDVKNLNYDKVKNLYELTHEEIIVFEINSDIFDQFDQNARLSLSIGKDIVAIFPIEFLQAQIKDGETISFLFNEVKDPKLIKGSVSKVFNLQVKIGEKEITQFDEDVTLVFAVDNQVVKSWDNLQVVYVNESGEKVEFIDPITVNRTAHTVTANVSHFSMYGVFEEVPVTENPDPEGPIEGELADGEYTIDFKVLKNNTDETSVMDDYTVKPGLLTVEKQKTYVTVTLKNSDWIKVFQTEQNGVYTDAEVVQTNKADDTRDVRFEVGNLHGLLNAYTEVYFEESIVYDGKYNVQFAFNVDSIASLGESGNGPNDSDNNNSNNSNNNNNGTDKGTDQQNKDDQTGNAVGASDEDNLTIDRNSDGSNESTTSDTKVNKVLNTKTADTAMIGLLLALLAGSAFWLIRRYRLRTL
nr:NEAT domain-containing protein [Lederbergia lenta]